MQYTIKSRSRINRIQLLNTVKLINHSVLYYLKNSLKVFKRFSDVSKLTLPKLQFSHIKF